jgi:diguanylate cyclase (GGDEF)-like protein
MDPSQIVEYGSAGDSATPSVDGSAIPNSVAATQPSPHLYAINAFTASLVIATSALFFGGALGHAAPIRVLIPQPAMFVVLCVLWAAASLAPVVLHHRGNSYDFVLDAAPMLLGLVFLSPALFIASVVCAEAFVRSVVNRQAPVKVAFNVASVGLSSTVAVLIYRGILGTSSPVGLRGWPAAAAALCAFSVILSVNLWVVIKLAGQTPERRTGSYFAIQAMLTAASVCLAFVVLDTAWFNVWAILPLLLVGGLIIVVYRAYYRLWLKFASLSRLHESTRTLGMATLEPSSMSLEVLEQVCTVMRARRAQLVFAEPSGIPRRISLDNHMSSGIQQVSLDPSSLVTSVITSGKPDRRSRDAQHGAVFTDPIVGEYRDAVIAPLMNGQVTIGAIVVLDRDEEADSFDDEDLQVFGALVAAASANLARANLVEELRYEVDAREFRATHDALTRLPNRFLFVNTTAEVLSEHQGVAVVLWDIDRFQDVNDTLGHAIGDRLLLEVSERLQRAVSGRATVACFGADEFALVLAGVTEAEEAIALVDDLNRELSRTIKMDGLSLRVKASAGISLAPEHGDDATLLLQRADIALRLAKERHSNVEVYSFEHDRSRPRRQKLGGLLTHALEQKTELSVVYQPVGDIRSGDIVQVEALARWHHPEYGSIPPEEFVAIAEDMGMISEITEFVLAESCAQLARWRTAGIHIGVAVNTSVREYSDDRLVERVARHLAANDIPPDLLTLEVTETVVVDDFTQASQVLEALAALGVRIAIDDYGTGYSSLKYLHRLPVHKLKIDRSFVTNLPSDLSNAIIVRSSIAMAHSLGLTVVAEGAEDEVTCAMLADAECDSIQGYYLAKPMEPAELESWLLQGARLTFRTFGDNKQATPGLVTTTVAARAQAAGGHSRHLGPRPLQPTTH